MIQSQSKIIPDLSIEETMTVVMVGHVDHGKSTVLGRILADTHSIPEEKVQQIQKYCHRRGKSFEYAYLIDALQDERAQGITIDAARIFFESTTRRYIILDAPGHVEFVKNMVTGAARADAAVLVIDAVEGIQDNSRRHGQFLSLLGINQIIVVVNKMDQVDYDQRHFNSLANEYSKFLSEIKVYPKQFVPASGKNGVNIVNRSKETAWYFGPTVLDALEKFQSEPLPTDKPLRIPIQDIYKFTQFNDERRIVVGTVGSGNISLGDELVFFPSGKKAKVSSIESFNSKVNRATAGESVAFTLTEQLYLQRGEVACKKNDPHPVSTRSADVNLFWLDKEPLQKGQEYILKMGTATTEMKLKEIHEVFDVTKLKTQKRDWIDKNECAKCEITLNSDVAMDTINDNATTGRFVIVHNYRVCGGGLILKAHSQSRSKTWKGAQQRNSKWITGSIDAEQRRRAHGQKEGLLLITGPKSAPRKEIASLVERELFNQGKLIYFLGMGNVLYGMGKDISDHQKYRYEHIRRMGEIAHILLRTGMLLVVTAVELTHAEVEELNAIVGDGMVDVVWVGNSKSKSICPDLELVDNGHSDFATNSSKKIIELLIKRRQLKLPNH